MTLATLPVRLRKRSPAGTARRVGTSHAVLSMCPPPAAGLVPCEGVGAAGGGHGLRLALTTHRLRLRSTEEQGKVFRLGGSEIVDDIKCLLGSARRPSRSGPPATTTKIDSPHLRGKRCLNRRVNLILSQKPSTAVNAWEFTWNQCGNGVGIWELDRVSVTPVASGGDHPFFGPVNVTYGARLGPWPPPEEPGATAIGTWRRDSAVPRSSWVWQK
jgi:hypothetical protein